MIYILTKNAQAIIATLIGVGIVGELTFQAVMVNQQVQQLKKAVYEKPMVVVATPIASPSATLSPTQGVFKYSPLPSKSVIVK